MTKYLPQNFRLKPVSALVALSLGLSSPFAFAQEEAQETEKEGLETIVITAQKRAQNLQEVPVSVTAFTGDEMAESAIKDLYDLRTNVPGLSAFQSQSATNSSFSIRGIGTSSQNFGLESSVGLYVDGVYRARQNSLINNLIDIEAVEVLRGPQGTLFGKNTPSGAVLVRTVKPDHDGTGFVEATVGNLGLFNISGAKSFSAIEDVLAFRISAFNSDRDGIVDDINLGDDLINDRNRWGVRAQALYTPNEDFELRIIVDKAEIDEICCAALTELSNFMATDIPGKFGTDAALSQPPFNADIFSGDTFFDRRTALSTLPISQMEDDGISAEINWDLNDNYTLVSVSAIRNFDSLDFIDTDFTNANLFQTTNDAEQSSFSQELRLDYTGENLNFILGAYYFEQEIDLRYKIETLENFNDFYSLNLAALQPIFDGINALNVISGGLIAPAAQGAPGGTSFSHLAEQEHESYAVFGQFDYKFNDAWTLTAGLRFTSEEKQLNVAYSQALPDGSNTPTFFNTIGDPSLPQTLTPDSLLVGAGTAGAVLGGILSGQIDIFSPAGQQALQALVPFQTPGWGFQSLTANTAQRPDVDAMLDDDQVTGTLKLSYQPDSESLYYASFGTGYKSGGTNTDRIAFNQSLPADDPAQLNPVFGAETSESFEIGMKKDFPDQNLRVNAALHYTTVEDFQANTFTGQGFNLQNAGDIKTSGLELEVTWLPADTWEVNFAYARTNAEFETFERGNCWVAYTWHTGIQDPGQANPQNPNPYCDRSGDRLGSEPEDYAVLKLKKEMDLSDGMYSYLQLEYSYTGDMPLDSSNDPFKFQGSYNLLNMRFYMNFEDYDTDVIIWGRNILDEEYIFGTDFDVPIQDGKLMAYTPEPATFGITVKKRF